MADFSELDGLYKQLSNGVGGELEVSLSEYLETTQKMVGLGFETYTNLIRYAKALAAKKNWKLEKNISLDVSVAKDETGCRITINSKAEIDRYFALLGNRKNHVVAKVLLGRVPLEQIIRKTKDTIQDSPYYGYRVRLSYEEPLTVQEAKDLAESLDREDAKNVFFRYKQRISYFIAITDEVTLKLDLTSVKQGNRLDRLDSQYERFEVELEASSTVQNRKPPPDILAKFKKYLEALLKVVDQTDNLVTYPEKNEIIARYRELVKSDRQTLDGRQSISMELYHVVGDLRNRYAVTDKADGERYFGLVHKSTLYLISNNLHVRSSGLVLKNDHYDDTLLDGELIFVEQRFAFMIFDVLFYKREDVRREIKLENRLKHADEIVRKLLPENCLPNVHNEYNAKMEIDKLTKWYTDIVTERYQVLTHNLKKASKDIVLVQRKTFLWPFGIADNEIFKYATIIWDAYQKGLCPYTLDGLIFTQLEHIYTSNKKEVKFPELKWKPKEKNSVDFYLRFVRDERTGQILNLYDNCRTDTFGERGYLQGKTYRIANLYVGQSNGREESPVLFRPDEELYKACLFLQDGEARDIDGNPIQDSSVVEFYFNTSDPGLENQFRWVPIRTRWDKTESVNRYRRRYGNNRDVADKVWQSIQFPMDVSDFYQLAKDASFAEHFAVLKSKITQSMITQSHKENVYYARQSNLARPMRNFHNWIKSSLIYTICNPQYDTREKMYVLDVACGRGGDIKKFYFARTDAVVGIDNHSDGIFSTTDGALSRYAQFKQIHENFPPMFFIHADANAPLDAKSQIKILGNTTPQNIESLKRFFTFNAADRKDPRKEGHQKFHRINVQFALHFFLENDTTWNNFVNNVNQTLMPGGYMIITTFDADEVMKVTGESGMFSQSITDENGSKETMFTIKRKFDPKELPKSERENIKKGGYGTGYPIDFFSLTFQNPGDDPYTEYLVDKRFLKSELKNKCDMKLVETGMFSQLYNINKEYFEQVAPYEQYADTRGYLLRTKQFYDTTKEINRVSFELTRLYRYYVFQKSMTSDQWEESKQLKTPLDFVRRKVPLKKYRKVSTQVGGKKNLKKAEQFEKDIETDVAIEEKEEADRKDREDSGDMSDSDQEESDLEEAEETKIPVDENPDAHVWWGEL